MNRQGSFALYAMNPKYKKIYCCTPVAFQSNDGFWIRDTGLICTSLRNMGVESKCIMPLPFYNGDQTEHLIRTEYKNLKSVAWWKSLGIDALVLYSWGAPKYLPIARAVHKAGIKLLIHLDMNAYLHNWRNGTIRGYLKDLRINLMRRWHLSYADIISASQELIEVLANSKLYGKKIAAKCANFPTPVAPHFTFSTAPKSYKVTCIGRWSDEKEDKVKRPEFCIRTAQELVKLDSSVIIEIYGRTGNTIENTYDSTEIGKDRIILKGFANNKDLPAIYQSSLINYCTSESEGTHIASAEALCCGCSIVSPPRYQLRNLHWYASKNSGSIATEDTPQAMAKALDAELKAWKNGERSAQHIAEAWQPYFHVDKVFNKIFQ